MSDERQPSRGLSYSDSGVDIDRQDEALSRIKELVRGTRTPGVLADLGSFGGLFAPSLAGMREPVLVASADGVGTKLCVAFDTGVHDTVGRDLVNHCVNDILVQGARPLFFMDYVATGKLEPRVLEGVVAGIARGCRETGCALLGGETAEMPGFYGDDEYDVAGFIVGIVDKPNVLDGSRIRPGDRLIALPSAGLHTNGYSLARKIVFEVAGLGVADRIDGIDATVGQVLLAEHRCYLDDLTAPLEADLIHGLAHITGGGIPDNLVRVLPAGCVAGVRRASWEVPELFRFLQRTGNVEQSEMDRTFNMGVGMIAAVAEGDARRVLAMLEAAGAFEIGEITKGEMGVRYV